MLTPRPRPYSPFTAKNITVVPQADLLPRFQHAFVVPDYTAALT